ncbi:MAG: nitroreductase family protein [Planctomycetes bacterium]|nr:nitroreductase family protein [Planctomycetota bacterium]
METSVIRDLIISNRSCRRFHENFAVERKTLEELVELARYSASAANLQPLKYILSCEPDRNAQIFANVAWAGYLKDWPGPAEGERPTAYIVVLGDTEINTTFGCDHGIAAQSILLGARDRGLAGCMIGLIKREELRKALQIPPRYEILLVLAIGKPKEEIVVDTVGPDGSIKYWRESNGVHHVPKRSLSELILG